MSPVTRSFAERNALAATGCTPATTKKSPQDPVLLGGVASGLSWIRLGIGTEGHCTTVSGRMAISRFGDFHHSVVIE